MNNRPTEVRIYCDKVQLSCAYELMLLSFVMLCVAKATYKLSHCVPYQQNTYKMATSGQ
jgi:hypothetical protein